jgi:hypothetical protein
MLSGLGLSWAVVKLLHFSERIWRLASSHGMGHFTLPFGHISDRFGVRRELLTWRMSALEGCGGKNCEYEKHGARWNMFPLKDKLRTRINDFRCVRLSLIAPSQGQCFGRRCGQGG